MKIKFYLLLFCVKTDFQLFYVCIENNFIFVRNFL